MNTLPDRGSDENALRLIVENRWTAQRVARETGQSYQAVEELVRQCGGHAGLRHALAEARAGRDPRSPREARAVTSARVVDLPTERVRPNPNNVRADLGDLTELAASIESQGVLQPLLVFQEAADVFVVIDGHRRLAATRSKGLDTVPCLINPKPSPDDSINTMLATAMHQQLNPIEQASAFERLTHMGLTPTDIARSTGHRPTFVRGRLALLALPEEVRTKVATGQVKVGAAQTMARKLAKTGAGTAPIAAPRTQYFTPDHPLAADVSAACTHAAARTLVGGVGCGQCWERVIAAAASRAAVHMVNDLDTAGVLSDLEQQHLDGDGR